MTALTESGGPGPWGGPGGPGGPLRGGPEGPKREKKREKKKERRKEKRRENIKKNKEMEENKKLIDLDWIRHGVWYYSLIDCIKTVSLSYYHLTVIILLSQLIYVRSKKSRRTRNQKFRRENG